MTSKGSDNLTDIPAVKAKTVRSRKTKFIPRVPAVMGRPALYSEELAQEICTRIMGGRPLSKVCQDNDMPSRDTVYTWLASNHDFSDKYARACIIRRENRFENLEDIAENEEDVARARLRIDVIKWQLSKEDPKKYSERQEPAPTVTFNFGTQNYVKKLEAN